MSTHDCEFLNCDLANNIHAPSDYRPLPYVQDGGHRERVVREARLLLLAPNHSLVYGLLSEDSKEMVRAYQVAIIDLVSILVFAQPDEREGIELLLGVEKSP